MVPCEMRIFIQHRGMRVIIPHAYRRYSEDKILSVANSLGKKTNFRWCR